MLLLDRPWTRQPKGAAGVNPLAFGDGVSIVSVINPAFGAVDLVTPTRSVTRNTNTALVATPMGLAYAPTDGNSGLIFTGGWDGFVAPSKSMTVFALVYVGALGARRILLADYSLAGGGRSLVVEASTTNVWTIESQAGSTSGGTVTVGWHTVVASVTANSATELWINGVSVGGVGGGSARTAGNTAAWLDSGAYTGGIGWGSANRAALMVVAEGYASAAVAKRFAQNPWALFNPRRIWVPVSAGGSGPQTVAISQASESDTAQTFSATVGSVTAIGQASESNAAQALTTRQTKAIGQAVEADAAQALAAAQRKALGQAAETDTAQAWTLRSAVQADSAQAWTLRSAVQADSAQAWTLRSAVQADSAQAWTLRSAVQADSAQAWTLRSAVQADSAQAWSVLNSTQAMSDRSIAWTLRSAVQADSAQAWSVLNSTQATSDRSINWLVRSVVQADSAQAWTLRSAVQADSAQAWTLRSAVQRDSLQSWLTYQSVIANRDLAWAVGAVASVVSDTPIAWTTRASLAKDRSLSWVVGTTAVPPVIRLKVTFTKLPTFVTRTVR